MRTLAWSPHRDMEADAIEAIEARIKTAARLPTALWGQVAKLLCAAAENLPKEMSWWQSRISLHSSSFYVVRNMLGKQGSLKMHNAA